MSLEGIYFSLQELLDAVKSDQVDRFFEYYLNLNNLILTNDDRSGQSSDSKWSGGQSSSNKSSNSKGSNSKGSGRGSGFFHTAIRNDNLELIQYLIQEKAYLLAVDHDGYSPVELAVRLEKWEIVELFLKNGFDVNHVFYNGRVLMDIVLDNSNHRTHDHRFGSAKRLFEMGAEPFRRFARYFLQLGSSGLPQMNGDRIALIDRLFADGRILKIPSKYQSEYMALLFKSPDLTPKMTEWIGSNKTEIKKMLHKSSNGLSFAETLCLTRNQDSHRMLDLLDLSEFLRVLSPAAQKIVSELKPLISGRLDSTNSIGYQKGKNVSKMTLIEACFDYYDFWFGERIWYNLVFGRDNWSDFIQKIIIPLFDQVIVFDQSYVIQMITVYHNFYRYFEVRIDKLVFLMDRLVEHHPKVQIENVRFDCCDLLNYCLEHRFWSLAFRIMQGCDLTKIPLVCHSGCGSLIHKMIRSAEHHNVESISSMLAFLSSKGVSFESVVSFIRDGVYNDFGFKLIVKYVIKFLDWSTLRQGYRNILEGPLLKELDAQKPFVFSRKDPISNEDLQEIDSSRLVIVNLIPWDLENLVQYVIKVTKGQNVFDDRHPLKGRPIWIDQRELNYLFTVNIEVPDENLGRVSNIVDQADVVDAGGSAGGSAGGGTGDGTGTAGTGGGTGIGTGTGTGGGTVVAQVTNGIGTGRGGRIIYGDLLRGYLEVEALLEGILEEDFDELNRICSILWARGEPFDREISKILTPEELSEWSRWKNRLGNQSMPEGMPSGLSRKIEDLKFLQLASLDIWYHTTMKNKQKAISKIWQICRASDSGWKQYFNEVLDGTYCVMSFSYHICLGYNRSKIVWNRRRLDAV